MINKTAHCKLFLLFCNKVMIIQNSFVDLYRNKKHTLIFNKQNIIIMTSKDILNNQTFINEGVLFVAEETLIALYNESELTWNGLEYAGGRARDIIMEQLGICFVCAFKNSRAQKTKTGRIKKSEYKNPKCYAIEVQKCEEFFKAKFN